MNIRSVSTSVGAALALAIVFTSASWTLSALPASLVSQFRPSARPAVSVPEPVQDGTRIIDNGDPTYLTDTIIQTVENAGYRNDYDIVRGRAAWRFDKVVPGEYEVLATWQARKDAPNKMVYRAIDTLFTKKPVVFSAVDQRKEPVGDSRGGVQWQSLGTVKIESGQQFWIIARDSAWLLQRPIIADAVMLRPVGEPQCGNGVVEAGEQCDDGNSDNNDYCNDECKTAVCGDNVCQDHEKREICDSDRGSGHDECYIECETDCQPINTAGQLNITQHDSVVRQALGGAVSEPFFFLTLSSVARDNFVEDIIIDRLNFSVTQYTENVDYLTVSYNGALIGRASRVECAGTGDPLDFCLVLNDEKIVVPANGSGELAIAAYVKSDTEGGESGEIFEVNLSASSQSIVARGKRSGYDLNSFNGSEEEADVNLYSEAGDRSTSLASSEQQVVMFKFKSIRNASEDPDGTPIDADKVQIGRFAFDSLFNRNTLNGTNKAIITDLVLTVDFAGVLFDKNGFRVLDESTGQEVDCRALSSSDYDIDATYNLSCNTEIEVKTGESVYLTVFAHIISPNNTVDGANYVQTSIQHLNINKSATPEIRWIDTDFATENDYYWVDVADPVYSTLYGSKNAPYQGCGYIDCGEGYTCEDVCTLADCAAGQSCPTKCQAVCVPVSTCGNGIVEPGEQCDDGASNDTATSTCTDQCQLRECTSDNQCPGAQVCSTNSLCTLCGNGIVEPGEQCDDGASNGTAASTCNTMCEYITCTVGGSELGGTICDPEVCTTDADCPALGAPNASNICLNGKCTVTICGNGIVEPGEQCDKGDRNGTDYAFCTQQCTVPACETSDDCPVGQVCGQGTCVTVPPPQCVDDTDCPAGEACYDGVCHTKVPVPYICGDGKVEPGSSEQCDLGDQNGALFSGCSTTCGLCPVPGCIAPPAGCRYVDTGEVGADGCPAQPCGKLVCENKISLYDVDMNTSVYQNTYVDITVVAIDENNRILEDYLGSFTVTTTDPLAKVPAFPVQFKESDLGVKQLKLAIRFATAGEQTVVVQDVNQPDVRGAIVINVASNTSSSAPYQCNSDNDCSNGQRCLGNICRYFDECFRDEACPAGEICHSFSCTTPSNTCGNGVIETKEQCDDGNTSSGDGCSSLCRKEIVNSSSSQPRSSVASCQLKADFNRDGIVDARDLTTIAINLTNPANNLGVMVFAQGDANGDGRVNGADLMIAIGELDKQCPVRSSSSAASSQTSSSYRMGNLYIEQDSVALDSQQLLGGTTGDPVLRLIFRAENEPVEVTQLPFVSNSKSIDVLRLSFDGVAENFATAKVSDCRGVISEYVSTYCALLQDKMIIQPNQEVVIKVRPVIKSDTLGGQSSADPVTVSLVDQIAGFESAIRASGYNTSRDLVLSDANGQANGEIFVHPTNPGSSIANQPITSQKNHIVMSKFTISGLPTNIGSIPVGGGVIGTMSVTSNHNPNTLNRTNESVLSGVILTINASNVVMDSYSFTFSSDAAAQYAPACQVVSIDGSQIIEREITGTFHLVCQNFAGMGDIRSGSQKLYYLKANVINSNSSTTGQPSSLSVSLQNFDDIDQTAFGVGQSHIFWIDQDSATYVPFYWVESEESEIRFGTLDG